MRFAHSYFIVLAVANHGLAHTHAGGISKFDTDVSKPTYANSFSARAPAPQPRAKVVRFAPDPPPKFPGGNPKRHAVRRGLHTTGPHVRSAPRPQVSALPSTHVQCRIQALHENKPYGYIAPVWNAFGQYYQFQSDPTESLLVSFSYLSDSPSRLMLAAANSPGASYPLFGAVVGYDNTDDNLSPGSSNHAPIVGTTLVAPGSQADAHTNSFSAKTDVKKTAQSAIWTYDPISQDITAQWVNTDGSAPATHIVHYKDRSLVLTGDPAAFQAEFGAAKVLTFKCAKP